MTTHSFNGLRAKIDRARKHITELRQIERVFFETHKPIQVVEPGDGGLLHHKIRMPAHIDADAAASIVASDIIGALRATLDIAVCECARISGANDVKHTYFHFASTEEEWDKSSKGKTKAAPQTIVAVMRALKPWNDGNRLLYALSRLAVSDKHQLLTPVSVSTDSFSSGSVRAERCRHLSIPGPNWDFEKNECTYLVTGVGDVVHYDGIEIRTFMGFGKIDPIAGQPIVPILDNLCAMIEDIVGIFEGEMNRPK